jgi:hypothetical protein
MARGQTIAGNADVRERTFAWAVARSDAAVNAGMDSGATERARANGSDIFLFHPCDIDEPCGDLLDHRIVNADAATSRQEIGLLTGARARAMAGGRSRARIKVGS